MNLRPYFPAAFLALILLSGCGSDDDSGDAASSDQSRVSGEVRAESAEASTRAPEAADVPTAAANDALPPVAEAIDPADISRVAALEPDEAIERYRSECTGKDDSSRCRALRRRVEYLFLDALVTMREAGVDLDPKLCRVAAQADNPRLAVIGLEELIFAGKPTAEDTQVIVDALDNPYAAVRNTVLVYARSLPEIQNLWPRVAADYAAFQGLIFLDESVSREPDPAIINSYPGARYRYFASDASRHWYTTQGSPEQVIAFLTRGGKRALTAEELKASIESQAQQIYMQAISSGDENAIATAMKEMTATAGVDWTAPLRDVAETAEISYIRLGRNRVVAVFADPILDATSIVVPIPAPVETPFEFDMQDPDNYQKALEEYQQQLETEQKIQEILRS